MSRLSFKVFLIFALSISASAVLLPRVADAQDVKIIRLPHGTVLTSAVWKRKQIEVCWENPDAAPESRYLDLVRGAVDDTWVKYSQLSFIGWEKCTAESKGIHIFIDDDGPHVKALGRYLDARPQGMVLNFTFKNWSTDCQNDVEFCIWSIAAHEFGHAIGFAHEQNRKDAPFQCRRDHHQGTDGDWNVTTYDPQSIMNYCADNWNNDGKLSERDIEAVQTIYGAKS